MFHTSNPLKDFIRSETLPVDINPEDPIPDDHLDFLRKLEIYLTSAIESVDEPVGLLTAIASQWRFLWPWLKASLMAVTIFETDKDCSPDMCRTVGSCTDPVLTLIALILKSNTPKTTSFILVLFNTPHFRQLLSLCWAASLTKRTDSHYTQLILDTMRPLFDQRFDYGNIIHALGLELQLCSRRMFETSLSPFCVSLIADEYLGADRSFNGLRLYVLLHIFHFPECGAFSRLDEAESCLGCLCQVWRLLTPRDASEPRISGLDKSCTHELRLSCLERILSYLVIFLSGGASWVANALDRDHQVVACIAQSCRFLYQGHSDLEAVSALDVAVLRAFRSIIIIIHSHGVYHSVDWRIKSNFQFKIGAKRCTESLLLPQCADADNLQSSWSLLINDFCALQHIQQRRSWRSNALQGYCNYPQMFVFREVQNPLPENVNLVGDDVRSQLVGLISQIRGLAVRRGGRLLSAEDLIFHDRGKVNWLRACRFWKDVHKHAKDSDNAAGGGEVEEALEGGADEEAYTIGMVTPLLCFGNAKRTGWGSAEKRRREDSPDRDEHTMLVNLLFLLPPEARTALRPEHIQDALARMQGDWSHQRSAGMWNWHGGDFTNLKSEAGLPPDKEQPPVPFQGSLSSDVNKWTESERAQMKHRTSAFESIGDDKSLQRAVRKKQHDAALSPEESLKKHYAVKSMRVSRLIDSEEYNADAPHARKTARNQPQHGTHTASLGSAYLVNRSLVDIYMLEGSGLMPLRDVDNADKQGDVSVEDRILAAFRARFWLNFVFHHILHLSKRFPDFCSTKRPSISAASLKIFNRLCDTLLLLVIAYSEYFPDVLFFIRISENCAAYLWRLFNRLGKGLMDSVLGYIFDAATDLSTPSHEVIPPIRVTRTKIDELICVVIFWLSLPRKHPPSPNNLSFALMLLLLKVACPRKR
ncbi:hypothetical protein C8R42DRAFT_725798 [Lentinula raphanica]|nr:hypothetical protein C8R42DRAFT_725798 [Lentinula raphanica]